MTDPSDLQENSPTLPAQQTHPLNPEELRRQAEEGVKEKEPLEAESLTLKETGQMLHELQVHQIELEMQNEELRRAQEKLDVSRTRYFDLYDLAPVGYFSVSKEGLILKSNLTAANMLSVTRGELVKQPITRLFLKEDEDKFYLLHKKLLETSKPQECDLRMIKKDSTIIWVWIGAILANNTDGTLICNIAISDITARKKAEIALQESEERYRALAENSPDLITRFDRDLKLIYANPSSLHRIGKSIDELKGHTAQEYGANSASTKVWELIANRVLETGRPQRFENKSFWQDHLRIYDILVIPEYGAEGAVTSIINIARDITERKKAEEELQKAHDELEMRVEVRTAELKRVNEALAQSNLALEDFSHVAAHDLQEPLRKVITFAERLIAKQSDSFSEQDRDYLTRMQSAATRMRLLIDELVKFSRVTSDNNSLRIINLKKPVEDAVRDLSVILEESGGRIEIDGLPDVEANGTQMSQLFQNLIGNALKYRSDHPPLIRIYSSSSTDNGFHEIYVTDNGIGFEESYCEKIFKPFQRLHGKSSPYQGTGMGLAICRKIVEHHGGSITAKSEPGKGSTFIVRLPKAVSTGVHGPNDLR